MYGLAVNHGYSGPNVGSTNGCTKSDKELNECKICFKRSIYIEEDGYCANCEPEENTND